MPLPVTPSYEIRLSALRSYAPEVAALAARITQAMKPEALAQPASALESDLFDHLQAVGRQEARSVTRLSVWFYSLVHGQALQHAEAAAFLAEAASHGGPKGVTE
ncbi:hypothetical protein FBY02_103210 [Pseudomonas sp. SJZ078]|uniref:hypothetical protein n=1 Tax=Pseudomonas sp. SJZ078 TaxID=2572886 RepID=UPI0011A383DC|nr:hypothetical protein [Pseudomonas sp. SJZ078]TWC36674.1 hypothetical protein FBY02_103210 [Pseudomonas sp. SJZ078]